jgi:hypothetical protein
MKILLLSIFAFAYFGSLAQPVTSPYLGDHYRNALLQAQKGQYMQVGVFKVSGSPLLLEKEFQGEVVIENGGIFNMGTFGYNLYTHQVSMTNGAQVGEIKSRVKYFKFNLSDGKTLTFINNDSVALSKKGFLLELEKGKNVELYRYSYCSLVENPSFISAEYRLFDANTEYYMTMKGSDIKKLKLNRKSILKALGNSDKIANFIDTNNINFSVEAEVARIFAYANTL